MLAALAVVALAVGGLLAYAGTALFDSDGFADRTAAALREPAVRDVVADRLGAAVIAAEPDLVALRPIVDSASRAVVGTAAFRSLVRRAARDLHRSAFTHDADDVTLRVGDAGLLLTTAVRRLRPDAARRIPIGMRATIVRIHGGVDGALLGLAERAEGARRAKWAAFVAAALLALLALGLARPPRAGILRLGLVLAATGTLVAVTAWALPQALPADLPEAQGDAVQAALRVWLDPIVNLGIGAAVAGLLIAIAAASVVRPVPVVHLIRRGWAAITAPPRSSAEHGARIAAALVVGVAMVLWPRTVLTATIVVVGLGIGLAAFAELLALVGGEPDPAPRGRRRRRRGLPRTARVLTTASLLTAGLVAAAAIASGNETEIPTTGRCNGHASLCDRHVDEVAFLGTHNAMAAADEPGWLFAAQDTGIAGQLADGVRALMIDTHYGIPTSRGVWTDLTGDTKSRAKIEQELGPSFVTAAEQARTRIGGRPNGPRETFLCHAFCEVGATRAVAALRDVHRFLVSHPEEVLILSFEDDTSAEDTEALIRASGLIGDVYRGRAQPPWPTLREMIDRDERVIVLVENHAGRQPWMHHQQVVTQETPYRFRTPAELAAPASCEPNRGGTVGSLLLVNHWIDTTPAPRITIARQVNAHRFLTDRLARCRTRRGIPTNILAVDFYRQGDAAGAVDALNGVR